MKKMILMVLMLINYFTIVAQNIDDISFGTDTTLEVVTWNIERFPKNGQTTLDYVKQIIENVDADVFAFQEITDTTLFKQMLSQLPQYEYYFKSSWYAGLAYIYKPEVVQINDIYEIYTSSPYWSPFPRSPMVMDLNYRNKNYMLINNHFKCCGDGILNASNSKDEEARRYKAANLLKEYIDKNLADKRVIVVGDLNDEITDNEKNNVFINIINDSLNYLFADMDIAKGESAGWSYPSYPSHLDHLLITNELFIDFQNTASEIKVLKIDEFLSGGWNEYDANVSDHRPDALKIEQTNSNGILLANETKSIFYNYPNPVNDYTMFNFPALQGKSKIEILDLQAKVCDIIYLRKGQTELIYHTQKLHSGMYIVKLIVNGELLTTKMLVN